MKRNKLRKRRTNTAWYDFYMGSKTNVKPLETECRKVVVEAEV